MKILGRYDRVIPEPYQTLAKWRATRQVSQLTNCFPWDETPEGSDFWVEVSAGRNPEIPEASMKEIENLNQPV